MQLILTGKKEAEPRDALQAISNWRDLLILLENRGNEAGAYEIPLLYSAKPTDHLGVSPLSD